MLLAPTQSQLVQPSSDQLSILLSAPPDAQTDLTWRLIDDTDGSIVIAESSDAIVSIDDGHDSPLVRYQRVFTAPATAGRYLAIWRYQVEEVDQTVVVAASADIAFATLADVTSRLGRALTSRETANVPFLLNMAAATIADAAGYDDGWAASLDPVPQMLRLMSVELVCRTLPNPSQYSQVSQQVGAYQFSARQDLPGMKLSPQEEMMIRRAVHGRTTDSVHIESAFQRAQDEYWARKQAARFSEPGSASVIA